MYEGGDNGGLVYGQEIMNDHRKGRSHTQLFLSVSLALFLFVGHCYGTALLLSYWAYSPNVGIRKFNFHFRDIADNWIHCGIAD